jgi:hypothetical protein
VSVKVEIVIKKIGERESGLKGNHAEESYGN